MVISSDVSSTDELDTITKYTCTLTFNCLKATYLCQTLSVMVLQSNWLDTDLINNSCRCLFQMQLMIDVNRVSENVC